jgi:hypothetical protein
VKINYDNLDAYTKTHKKLLESMSDKEYNDHINTILEELHYDEKKEEEDRGTY